MRPLVHTFVLIVLIGALSGCVATTDGTGAPGDSVAAIAPTSSSGLSRPAGLVSGRVLNVVDGDTMDVLVDGQEERLRLIGVDTPESVAPSRPVECYGREASAFTRELALGETVYLEEDPSQDDRDRFGRMLRFVWLEDGRLVNYEILAQGYGFEYTYNVPYKYQAELRAAQNSARETQAGLWAPAACNGEQKPADAAAAPLPTQAPVVSFAGCDATPDPASAPNAPVEIVAIDKRAEIVTLRNVSEATVSLDGWVMCSIRGGQVHEGIGGDLQPGEERDFPADGSNIWSNTSPDPGALYDEQGRLAAYWED